MLKAKHIILLTIALLLWSTLCVGQRIPQDALYLMNNISLNPAYTGNKDQWYAHLYYAKQWLHTGTPDFANISVDGSISPKANFGFFANTEGMGLSRTVNAAIAYTYRLPLTEYSDLSLGISVGAAYNYIDVDAMQTLTPNDPALNSFVNAMSPLVNVGIFYESGRYFAGLSLRNLSGNSDVVNVEQSYLLPPEKRNAIATFGAYFNVGNDIDLVPSLMWQEDMVTASIFDFSISLLYKSNYRIGLSIRTEQPMWKADLLSEKRASYAASLGGEMFYNRFVFGYTYTLGLNSFVVGYLGRHSLSLGYYLSARTAYRYRLFHFKRHTEYCPTCYGYD
jgi:type IX secretion system PorP/SprF family membrane protein